MLDLDALKEGRLTRRDVEAILSQDGVPDELFVTAGKLRDRQSGRELRFYYPKPRFPSVSITGASCALRCKHCGGHYLAGMRGA